MTSDKPGVLNKIEKQANPRLRVVFWGKNGDLTLAPLRAVAENHDIVGIVTAHQPEKQRSRLHRLARTICRKTPVQTLQGFAETNRIPCFFHACMETGALVQRLKTLEADLFCISSFNRLLSPELFTIPRLGTINRHAALLPAYRGPNPYFWQFFDQVNASGVTIHRVDSGEDTGSILLQQAFQVPFGMTGYEFMREIRTIGSKLMVQAVHGMSLGVLPDIENPRVSPTKRAARLRKGTEYTRWNEWPSRRVFGFLRGVMPLWYTPEVLRKLHIENYELIGFEESSMIPPASMRKRGRSLYVGCRPGHLVFSRKPLKTILRKFISRNARDLMAKRRSLAGVTAGAERTVQ